MPSQNKVKGKRSLVIKASDIVSRRASYSSSNALRWTATHTLTAQRQKLHQKNERIEEGFEEKKFFNFEISYLRRVIGEATLGYLLMDLAPPPTGAYWGKFNNRTVNSQWVEKLFESFIDDMDHFSEKNAIEVAVKPAWLDESLEGNIAPTLSGFKFHDVPLLKFSEPGTEAIQNNNLWMLSGNHRRLALLQYVNLLKMKLEEEEGKAEDVVNGKSRADLEMLAPRAKKGLKDTQGKIEKFQEQIDKASKWVVKLYDRGERSHA